MSGTGKIDGAELAGDPRSDNRSLYLSVGAVVMALGAIFTLITSSPWVSQREHQDLVTMMQTRDEELSKRVDAQHQDLAELAKQVGELRERMARIEDDHHDPASKR